MLNYAYRAIDRDGNPVAGTLAASDEQALAEKLQTIGYWLVEAKTCKIEELKEPRRVKRVELAELFANLATLLDAGLSIVAAMRTLEKESEDIGLQRVLTDVRLNIAFWLVFTPRHGPTGTWVFRIAYSTRRLGMV